MSENAKEDFGGVLARIGAEDRERAERRESAVRQVNRRQGNKGSRVWGYATPGAVRRVGREK